MSSNFPVELIESHYKNDATDPLIVPDGADINIYTKKYHCLRSQSNQIISLHFYNNISTEHIEEDLNY